MRNYDAYDTGFLENILNQYWNNQQAPQQQAPKEDVPQEQNTQEDSPDYESQISDLTDKNNTLQRQLDDYDFQMNGKPNDTSFLNSLFSTDGNTPTDFTNESDAYRKGINVTTNKNISWLKTKDSSVNLSDLNEGISSYLNSIPDKYKNSLLATSGDDYSGHVKNSKHFSGNAIDLRYNPDLYNYIANDPSLQSSGLKVLNPNHGTAPHIHIQTKKYGGEYMAFGGDPKQKKPIYTDDPKDPRIRNYQDSLAIRKDYSLSNLAELDNFTTSNDNLTKLNGKVPTVDRSIGNYKNPVQPILYRPHQNHREESLLNTQNNYDLPSIPSPTMSPQEIKLYQMQGNQPVYGQGNSLLGMLDSNNFYPDYMNTAKRTNVNQQDSDLINNPDALKQFLQRKGFKGNIQSGKFDGKYKTK